MRITLEALEKLEHGENIQGILSYQAVERARSLATLVTNGAGNLAVRGFGREVELTRSAADYARDLLAHRYRSIGSVEGRIETVSIHESRPYFNVFHTLDDHAVKCRCDEELIARAKDALGSRVRVSGIVFRRFDGRAEVVDVSDFRVFPARSELPQPRDIRGIYANGNA